MQEVGVGIGEFLLRGDGDDLPIGFVNIHDHIGVGLVVTGRFQLAGQLRHLIGIDDLAAHEDRLLKRHGSGVEVVVVEMQGVVDFLADGIDRSCDLRRLQLAQVGFVQHSEDGLPHRAERIFEHQERVVLDGLFELGAHRLRALPDLRGRIGVSLVQDGLGPVADGLQRLRTAVADQREVAAVIHISTRGADVREIVGQRDFLVIVCHLDSNARLVQRLGGTDGAVPAIFERQDGLGRQRDLHGGQQQRGTIECLLHSMRHFFSFLHFFAAAKVGPKSGSKNV